MALRAGDGFLSAIARTSIYAPACGSGPASAGFVQSVKFVESHGGTAMLGSLPTSCVAFPSSTAPSLGCPDSLSSWLSFARSRHLAPMIFDRSIEVQFVIPKAVSMGVGILFTTIITLFQVPCALLFAQDAEEASTRTRHRLFPASGPSIH